jgi:hypothetical protein
MLVRRESTGILSTPLMGYSSAQSGRPALYEFKWTLCEASPRLTQAHFSNASESRGGQFYLPSPSVTWGGVAHE